MRTFGVRKGHEPEVTQILYQDKWIECTETAVRVRFYYFPFGTKTMTYSRIRAVQRVALGPLRGRGRIWGTANARYWAHLDPARPHKHTALVLDLGRGIKPFLTPDDPQAVVDAILAHAPIDHIDEIGAGPML